MRCYKIVTVLTVMLGVGTPLFAQGRGAGAAATPSTGSSNSNSGGTANGTGGGYRHEPCWKVAGISPSVLQQRRSIEEKAKTDIAALCSGSSLTPQQRAQQIKAIHEQTRQAIQALITPQQEEALKACHAARGNAEAPKAKGTGAGPCGEMPESSEPPASTHKFN